MYALTDSRDMLKRILNFPPETILTWKSHDSSIQQRTAIDDARKEKTAQHSSGRNGNKDGEKSILSDKKQSS
jgi:translation initiation factor 4E